MVGRGAHLGERGCEVHAVGRKGLERGETLVVVHRKYRVVVLELTRGKEAVCRKGAKCEYLGLEALDNRGLYYLLLLFAE